MNPQPKPLIFADLVTDDRVTPFLGFCLYCRVPEGLDSHVRLRSVLRWVRQCPRCQRVYIIGEPTEEIR